MFFILFGKKKNLPVIGHNMEVIFILSVPAKIWMLYITNFISPTHLYTSHILHLHMFWSLLADTGTRALMYCIRMNVDYSKFLTFLKRDKKINISKKFFI